MKYIILAGMLMFSTYTQSAAIAIFPTQANVPVSAPTHIERWRVFNNISGKFSESVQRVCYDGVWYVEKTWRGGRRGSITIAPWINEATLTPSKCTDVK